MQAKDRFQGPRRIARAVRVAATPALAFAGLMLAAAVAFAQPPAPPQPAPSAAARLIVSDVIIQGNRLVSTESIRNQMKTRTGKEFVAETLMDDVRALYKSGQFGNVYADKKDDGPGRVKVFVYIRDYPNVIQKVTFQGNRQLSKDDLESVTNLRVGMPLNPIVNKVACQRIVARYNEEGRPFAACDLIKGADPNDTEVIFNVNEGPITRVNGISFTGNTFLSSAVLSNRVNTSTAILGIGGKYNAAMTDNDVHELMKFYRSYGFHDVKVARELKFSHDGREVDVTFHVVEGVQYRLSDAPQVVGVKSMPKEALEAMNKVKPGDTYKQAEIEGDTERIKNYLGYQGKDVRVVATPVFNRETPGIMRVQYEVIEQAPARVGQIIVVGNERTKQNVILRQVPLYPGQVLSYPDIRQGERNLARLGIFESSPDGSVRPTITVLDNPQMPDSEFKDLLVSVQEASTGSLMFGVGVNSDSGLTGSIVLNERNFDITRLPTSFDDLIGGGAFRGAGQEFRLELVPGTQLQRYVATFREPFLFDSPYSLTTSGYFYQRYFNEYTEDRLGARVTLGRKLDDYWSAGVTARAEQVRVRDVQPWEPTDYTSVIGNNFLAGVRGNVTRDWRDSLLRPTEGGLLDVSIEQCFGDHTFTLANIDYSQYFTTFQRADGSGKQVLALHGQAGWASSNTPVYERYFGGGFRSIRGFEFRGVGPFINGYNVGGDFLLLASAEYQIPVRAADNVFVVGFVDSGTVSPRVDDWETYRVSAGFGVRFVVPMLGPVPIALDFGFPIVKGKYDREQVFNFFMGFTR
jgi:outer membrane protein insertion porin family